MKRILTIFLLGAAITLSACGHSAQTQTQTQTQKSKKEVKPANVTKLNTSTNKVDKKLTTSIKDEKGVISGQTYVQGKLAIGTLLLDKKVTDSQAKALANKYLQELKKQYKDKKINVQAVRNGKNIVNLKG
ncbi:hypothetical protein [Heyndrickxia acidicola]|uniref:Lipoprotein n=1 Tax=Heyndrickxia acidicola TaxID=209389 RepID=A0ABU6MFN7_9BACI|nr:hypothetical protein [Heyndrickxia acidicola]MED1203285.1 hypothetical protein [Heyndrickxia acidicola]